MSDYKPIDIDNLREVYDHLKIITAPLVETIYLTQDEWDSLRLAAPPSPPAGIMGYVQIGHPVKIVTAEERETILKLKALNNEPHPQIR